MNVQTATKPAQTVAQVLQEAAEAFAERDRLTIALRAADAQIMALCRAYDKAGGWRGIAPYHLRRACGTHGLLTQPE